MSDDKRVDRAVFSVSLALLVVLCVWPIWLVRFLPMQDYPQHLFLAHVLATFDDPSFNWSQHYAADFEVGPYALYYLIMRGFLLVVDIETAGKLWVSSYFVLIGAYVATEAVRRERTSKPLPWLALAMLPLGFNQAYYMGFQNFLVSIPVLLFALRAHRDMACQLPGRLQRSALLLWVVVLSLIHPYTLLVFIVLASATGIGSIRQSSFARTMLTPVAVLLVFIVWYVARGNLRPAHAENVAWALHWWPLKDTLAYIAMMFTGMQITEGPSIAHLILWSVVFLTIVHAAFRQRSSLGIELAQWHFFLCAAGVLVMPFWLGYFSYFNVRLAAIGYFIGAIALSKIALPRVHAAAIVLSSVFLVCLEVPQHQLISEEVETLLPVLHEMQPNQRVMPSYALAGTPHLDKKYFFEFHAHEHFYYHVLVGGGASPDLFPSGMIPIQFKSDAALPKGLTRLRSIAENYRYVLLRDLTGRQAARLDSLVRAQSGPWFLIDMTR